MNIWLRHAGSCTNVEKLTRVGPIACLGTRIYTWGAGCCRKVKKNWAMLLRNGHAESSRDRDNIASPDYEGSDEVLAK